MDIKKRIVHTFKDVGYMDVKVNVWNNVRVYVNLDETRSFSYDMTQNFKISSRIRLTRAEFEQARELIPLLKQHREQLEG